MVSSKRILGAEEIGDVQAFRLLELRSEGAATSAGLRIRPSSGREPPPGYREGFRRGVEEGVRRGSAETADRLQREHGERLAAIAARFGARAEALHAGMDAAFAELRLRLADDALTLALELARQVIRAELRTNPESIETVAREAVAALIDERSSFVMHMNPDEAAMLGERLAPVLEPRGARLAPDASIGPGGCRIVSASAEIDATVATRWRRVLAAIGKTDAAPPIDSPTDESAADEVEERP
jgi:flagellar assembly protein FliH